MQAGAHSYSTLGIFLFTKRNKNFLAYALIPLIDEIIREKKKIKIQKKNKKMYGFAFFFDQKA